MKIWRTVSLALGIFIIPSLAYAGVNVEARRADIEKDRFFGDFQFQGNLQYGNTNLLNIGVSGLAGYKAGRHTIFGFGNVSFTSENLFKKSKENIQNSEMVHIRHNLRLLRWLYMEEFTQAEADQNKSVSLRYLVGAGPRFYPYKGDQFTFVMGTSYMLEHERLGSGVVAPYPSGMDSRNTWVHRWNNYASFRADITDQFVFQTTIYVQPRFDRFKDIKVFNDNVLIIEINDRLDFNISQGVSFDKEPPIVCDGECNSVNRLDLSTQLSIQVEF